MSDPSEGDAKEITGAILMFFLVFSAALAASVALGLPWLAGVGLTP